MGVWATVPDIVNTIHHSSATGLFLVFAYMSIGFFTRTTTGSTNRGFLGLFRDPEKDSILGELKRKRNRVYRACGWIVIVCVTLIALSNSTDFVPFNSIIFWLETVALFAFGFSWLVKGNTLWREPESEVELQARPSFAG